MTTTDCFSRAVKFPTGVGWPYLPIDAGISRRTWPSWLTVKVWLLMLATPTVVPPVWKFVFAPPADTEIGEYAGQYSLGVHCRTRSLSQVNFPAGTFGD